MIEIYVKLSISRNSPSPLKQTEHLFPDASNKWGILILSFTLSMMWHNNKLLLCICLKNCMEAMDLKKIEKQSHLNRIGSCTYSRVRSGVNFLLSVIQVCKGEGPNSWNWDEAASCNYLYGRSITTTAGSSCLRQLMEQGQQGGKGNTISIFQTGKGDAETRQRGTGVLWASWGRMVALLQRHCCPWRCCRFSSGLW